MLSTAPLEIQIYVALCQQHEYLGREKVPKMFLVVQCKEFQIQEKLL